MVMSIVCGTNPNFLSFFEIIREKPDYSIYVGTSKQVFICMLKMSSLFDPGPYHSLVGSSMKMPREVTLALK